MSSFATMVQAAPVPPRSRYRNLNVASGNHYAPWWGVNFDLNFDSDLRADAGRLPFRSQSFEVVYMGHFLEHVPWEVIPTLLTEVRRVLVPGGVAMAVGPCIHRAILHAQPRHIIDAILSDPRDTEARGIGHAWTPTADLTLLAMQRGGFVQVEDVPITAVDRPEWPNPSTAPWQVAVRGVNP